MSPLLKTDLRYSRLQHLITRVPYAVGRLFVSYLAYVNMRAYMDCLLPLLAWSGMNIIGKPRYIGVSVYFDDLSQITLGDRVVISGGCRFLTHDYSVTTALRSIGVATESDVAKIRPITIGDNTFVGMNSIILPGARIGSNVIVGAGSVVRGTVDDFSLVLGNPSTVIGDVREYARKLQSGQGELILRHD